MKANWEYYGISDHSNRKRYHVWRREARGGDDLFQLTYSADIPPTGDGGYTSLQALASNGHQVTKK